MPTEQHTSEKMAWLNALEAACHPDRAPSSAPEAPPPAESPASASLPESSPAPADLDTATLAALYVRQGLFDRAVSVYERMLARDPGNTRLAVALEETRRLAREATRPRSGGTPPPSAPAASPARVAVAGGAATASATDGISIREQLRGILDGEAPGAAFLEASRREWLDGLGSLG